MRSFKEANQFIAALQQHWKQHLLLERVRRVTHRNLWSEHAICKCVSFISCLIAWY